MKTLVQLMVKLKVNYWKRKFIQKAPFLFNKQKILQLKLERIRLKSVLQETALRELFGKNARAVLFESQNGILVNNAFDVQVNQQLGNTGKYNWAEIEVLKQYIHPADCIYIIGTHIGSLLIPLSKQVNTVVGVEANPVTFENLNRNVLLNQVGNHRLFNYAIADKTGVVQFLQSKANSGGSKIKPSGNNYKYMYDHPDTVEVNAIRLDDLQMQYGLASPDFIIMDIEGYEFFALTGALNCLTHSRGIYIEFAPHHLKDIAGKSLQEFLSLLLPHFNTIYLMSDLISNTIDPITEETGFKKIQDLFDNGISDDLVCLKTY